MNKQATANPPSKPAASAKKAAPAASRLEGTLHMPAAQKALAEQARDFTEEGAPPPGFVGQHPPEVAAPAEPAVKPAKPAA